MHRMRRSHLARLLAIVFAVTLVAAACDGDDDEADGTGTGTEDATEDTADDTEDGGQVDGESVTGTIEASDQESDGMSVDVTSATLEGSAGFIVVHADDGGAPGEVVGHAPIPEGESTDVTVELDREIGTATYWPMLHFDAGETGAYEFPGPDAPVTVEGEIVMTPIEVTVS